MKNLILALALTCAGGLSAQVIQGQINNCPKNWVKLAYFYGQERLLEDSLQVAKDGRIEFTKGYPPGLYTIVVDEGEYFDLIIPKDGEMEVFSTEYPEVAKNLIWEKGLENSAFTAFRNKGDQINQLVQEGQLTPENAQGVFASFEEGWLSENGMLDIANIIQARNPQPMDIDINTNFRLWTRAYWENTAVAHPGVVRSPFLQLNYSTYFDKICPQSPDTLLAVIDVLFDLKMDTLVRNYLVAKMTQRFESSKIMGMDKPFVKMVDLFYRNGLAYWESEEALGKILDKANELSWNLIGSQAPNFSFTDSKGLKRNLHDVKSPFVLVVFWDATCSHCKKTLPEVVDFYKSNKEKGLEVLAITVETELNEWRNYLKEHDLAWINGFDNDFSKQTFRHYYYIPTTPTTLLLDASKTILAKNLKTADYQQFVNEQP
jgi:peroxiredoxin